MLSSLLPYVLTSTRPTVSTSGGEQTKSFSAIYTNIKCRYYPARGGRGGSLTHTDAAQQTKNNLFSIICEPDKINFQIGDRIVITGVDRTFIVEDAKVQKLFNGSVVDHMFITAKQE